jgi:uncharacterized protein (TIGR01777 family)
MKVFVTGATGLVGSRLTERLLQRGDEVLALTRSATRAASHLPSGVQVIEGQPQQPGEWQAAVSQCAAVVHLAGEPLFGRRWTKAQRQRLRDSRVESTRLIVQAMAAAAQRPQVLVNASAVGYYGHVPEGELTEDSPPGNDFLAQLCVDWEASALAARQHGVRVVCARLGVVLARHGGALKQMLLPFRLGVGGPVGRGRQWVSWIHLEDVVGVLLHAIDSSTLSGPVNATAPHPVRNRDLSRSLARTLRRPCWLPVPPFMLRVVLGGVATLVTMGQCVVPRRLLDEGFKFQFPTCEQALQNLLGRAASAV